MAAGRIEEDVDLDDDEIDMSELEELMDDITLEEEIEDEISFKLVNQINN